MKILALNTGSSSIKYSLFDAPGNDQPLVKGIAERIGLAGAYLEQTEGGGEKIRKTLSLPDHRTALHAMYQEMKHAVAIEAVGHRIVHGGEWYRQPVLIDKEVINNLKETSKFAPLHCQPNIVGVELLEQLLPELPHVAVFDTAVHATLPPKAYLYAIPMEYYEKHKIRKYGFHGINHDYVAREAAKTMGKAFEQLKIITCHLGNGCSITAFEKGRSVDNSMGLTPLEGLVMGTRSGDLDPAAVLYLIDDLGEPADQVYEMLNKTSGLLGLCGKSDMRDIIAAAVKGDLSSQTALEIFVYRVQKYIGAYMAALNGVDLIVFTGGIGENSPEIREQVVSQLSYVGCHLDKIKNQKNNLLISSDDSRILLMAIPANEELSIARQTYKLLEG